MKIKLLSPVHIDTGREIPSYEYQKSRSGDWYRVDLYSVISQNPPTNTSILETESGFRRYLENVVRQNDIAKFGLYKVKFSGSNISKDLKECMKTGFDHQPYLPGSSLKGSILTGYFYGEFKPNLTGYDKRKLKGNPEKEGLSKRFKISDAHLDRPEITISEPERRTKRRGNIRVWLEQIPEELTASAKISIINYKSKNKKKAFPLTDHDVDEICSHCKDFTDAIVQEEIRHFNYCVGKGYRSKIPQFYDSSGKMKKAIDSLGKKECVIRVGWGSNKNATSLALIDSRARLPKSRWLLNNSTPYGWLKVTFDKEDYE